jgi:hypothetical protein
LTAFFRENKFMSLGIKANDWQACGVLSLAGSDGIGGGLFIFDFFSAKANLTARFTFKGGGVGLGGKYNGESWGGDASGTAMPADVGSFGPWSSIKCSKEFSVWDLNGAWGRLTTLSGGIGLTFGFVYITAAPPWSIFTNYFASQNVGGFGTGIGVTGLILVGNWRYKQIVQNRPSPSNAATSWA